MLARKKKIVGGVENNPVISTPQQVTNKSQKICTKHQSSMVMMIRMMTNCNFYTHKDKVKGCNLLVKFNELKKNQKLCSQLVK